MATRGFATWQTGLGGVNQPSMARWIVPYSAGTLRWITARLVAFGPFDFLTARAAQLFVPARPSG